MKSLISHLLSACWLTGVASAVDPGTLYRNTIPADKHLDSAWVESLTERGHALDAGIAGSKADDTLKYIGMPVSGIATGTVYLNGDGVSLCGTSGVRGIRVCCRILYLPPKAIPVFERTRV